MTTSEEALAAQDLLDHARHRPDEPFDDLDLLVDIDHATFAGEVVDLMEASAPSEPELVRVLGRIVEDLAVHLDGESRAFLVGASRFVLAHVEAGAEQWVRALELLESARTSAPELSELVEADRHRVLGARAWSSGDLAAAATHWARAVAVNEDREAWGGPAPPRRP